MKRRRKSEGRRMRGKMGNKFWEREIVDCLFDNYIWIKWHGLQILESINERTRELKLDANEWSESLGSALDWAKVARVKIFFLFIVSVTLFRSSILRWFVFRAARPRSSELRSRAPIVCLRGCECVRASAEMNGIFIEMSPIGRIHAILIRVLE